MEELFEREKIIKERKDALNVCYMNYILSFGIVFIIIITTSSYIDVPLSEICGLLSLLILIVSLGIQASINVRYWDTKLYIFRLIDDIGVKKEKK